MRVAHNKLVRDRIPDIIQGHGHSAVTRVLADEDYRAALLAKLVEEAEEAHGADADSLPSELADVLEVVQALVTELGMTWDELLALTDQKRADRGGFDRRIFLQYVDQAG
jgi:predicted house-cleaning noncanonical NTP pyrophosphatase (MazG superfamily)